MEPFMTLEDIKTCVAQGESEVVEFKTTTGELRQAACTLCAMSNHRGGKILFGVRPDGKVSGQQVSDHTIEKISAEIQNIDPPIYPSIETIAVTKDKEVIVVNATQGSLKPYTYKGIAYQRVGNTNIRLSRDEYNRVLFERLHNIPLWENQPAAGWTIEDLDATEIRRTLEEAIQRGRAVDPGTRDPEALLRGLGLIRDGALLCAAAVLFGHYDRIEAKMPQCLLKVARFRGVGPTHFLDNRQFRGNAFELLAKAERFMIENLPVAGQIIPFRMARVDEPLYPPEALREALANALCHRDYAIPGGSVAVGLYEDRLEVTSTGSLPFGFTPEQLFRPHESRPWNPLIAGVFYRRGIIEQWGSGTLKMAALAQAAGLPQPEIEDMGGCVTVRFRSRPDLGDLTERQQAVFDLLNQNQKGMSLREIRMHLTPETSERNIRNDLYALRNLGMVNLVGHGRGARWRSVWALSGIF